MEYIAGQTWAALKCFYVVYQNNIWKCISYIRIQHFVSHVALLQDLMCISTALFNVASFLSSHIFQIMKCIVVVFYWIENFDIRLNNLQGSTFISWVNVNKLWTSIVESKFLHWSSFLKSCLQGGGRYYLKCSVCGWWMFQKWVIPRTLL
jgi:hypothetical protein